MIRVKTIISGSLDVNCYIIYDSKNLNAAIIDPGEDGDRVILSIEKDGFNPEILINTHGHYDHISSDDKIRAKFQIPLAIHKDDAHMLSDIYKNASALLGISVIIKTPDMLLEDNQKVNLSFVSLKVIHTPGHTKGGICLLFDGFLITGDTLFAGTIGRTDLDGGDCQEMKLSLSKIKNLDPSLVIYPGHGNSSTLANELRYNPHLL
jgi:glyoxylase-like metal-dependent hydrolase (beta-lactamase superfamily II)